MDPFLIFFSKIKLNKVMIKHLITLFIKKKKQLHILI
jgi:hypothetical protein